MQDLALDLLVASNYDHLVARLLCSRAYLYGTLQVCEHAGRSRLVCRSLSGPHGTDIGLGSSGCLVIRSALLINLLTCALLPLSLLHVERKVSEAAMENELSPLVLHQLERLVVLSCLSSINLPFSLQVEMTS